MTSRLGLNESSLFVQTASILDLGRFVSDRRDGGGEMKALYQGNVNIDLRANQKERGKNIEAKDDCITTL